MSSSAPLHPFTGEPIELNRCQSPLPRALSILGISRVTRDLRSELVSARRASIEADMRKKYEERKAATLPPPLADHIAERDQLVRDKASGPTSPGTIDRLTETKNRLVTELNTVRGSKDLPLGSPDRKLVTLRMRRGDLESTRDERQTALDRLKELHRLSDEVAKAKDSRDHRLAVCFEAARLITDHAKSRPIGTRTTGARPK